MTKVRKQRVKHKYRYNVNRKRLNKKKLPKLECKTIENAWNIKMSCQKNFKNMGLVYDVNRDIKSFGKQDSTTAYGSVNSKNIASKETPVIAELRANAKVKYHKTPYFSDCETKYLEYLIGKYGSDYKAMARDHKNYLQETWKQIRYKINSFQKFLHCNSLGS